ncbi:MAG: DNA polymerase III subunit gamma/tau [Alphaproteobacteria bacterium]
MSDSQSIDSADQSMESVSQGVQYRVLARKYRPRVFAELVGQEVLVRTLTNAIHSQRLAQAYVLTGVRGVGKTSTARIIARALNCIGPDGSGGPTVDPCGVCEHCRAIAEDRHVDVLEMDAASRTGVGDIRELIEGVRYRPTSARYKIYIIDEVHMLSVQAFNALLKTLEEPPAHVKFIFATTEIRKVPITVLSRCQRFDLRRVDMDTLAGHFAAIAGKEGARVDEDALRLIARAADGSVRDGLSLLDQAIAHADPGGVVSAVRVREMLGLADRTQVFDLFDSTMRGDIRDALDRLRVQYEAGADPVAVVQDLLELTHWLTRLKIVPEAAEDPTVPQAERVRGLDMAGRLSMVVLTRTWQMLLKALGEVRTAPSPLQAAEMALVRLAYAADLPSPAEAIESLRSAPGPSSPSPPSGPSATPPGGGGPGPQAGARVLPAAVGSGPQASLAQPDTIGEVVPNPRSFEELVALFGSRRELRLSWSLTNEAHLVHFEPGRLEFRPGPGAARDLANQVSRLLGEWTGRRWIVSISNAPGEPTLAERRQASAARRRDDVAAHPLVRAVLAAFPGAVVGDVRDIELEPERDPGARGPDDLESGDFPPGDLEAISDEDDS